MNSYNKEWISIENENHEYDENVGGHVRRVAAYFGLLLQKARDRGIGTFIPQEDVAVMVNAAQLHDVGKKFIPLWVLNQPRKLNDQEYHLVRKHTLIGAKYLGEKALLWGSNQNNKFQNYAMMFALSHHERWDGKGYPHGLRAEEIPLAVRILSIADVYDSLVSRRSYKEAVSHLQTVEIIEKEKGKAFDPILTNIFLEEQAAFEELLYRMTFSEF